MHLALLPSGVSFSMYAVVSTAVRYQGSKYSISNKLFYLTVTHAVLYSNYKRLLCVSYTVFHVGHEPNYHVCVVHVTVSGVTELFMSRGGAKL